MCDFCNTIYNEEEYIKIDCYDRFWEGLDGLVRGKNGIYYQYNADDPYYSCIIEGFKYCPTCGKELK